MKKILLVEDTAHLSEEIADVLRLEGYQVISAYNGLSALEQLNKSTPDLIVTDLLMPGMDGFDLIVQIRKIEGLQSIPIIILSAKTSETDRIRGREVGANDFVQKPCKAHELIASIDSFLK